MDPDLIELTEAQIKNLEALYEIAIESRDADSVRRSISALLATPAGVAYLTMHGMVM